MSEVRLISFTPDAEKTIAYCARVSSPENQHNEETAPRLVKYLIKHKHWSPFEMANMCVEITTSRAIATQILRHRSFSFQEFSQRYSEATKFEGIELRTPAEKNRQSSSDIINEPWLQEIAQNSVDESFRVYDLLIENGVAKECARGVLPLNTQTKLYMNGTIRSWIHYIDLRTNEDTQKEHREVAQSIKGIFIAQFPCISKGLYFA
jgi:thymidylate synthase (FAD)